MRVARWFMRNAGTFLFSFVLALIVWVSAVWAQDPSEVRPYPSPVIVQAEGLGKDMMVVKGLPRSVRVSLRAPRSLWPQIISDPDSVSAFVDLSGLAPGVYTVPVKVRLAYKPVQLVEVTPARIEVVLDYKASKEFPVRVLLSGQGATGYYAAAPLATPGSIVVSGAAGQVSRVSRVVAKVSIEGARGTIKRSVALQALDSEGNPVSGVSLSPSRVDVLVPVRQLGGYRDVAVKVVLRGRVANGYRITNVTVSPPVVTVFSQDPKRVRDLPGFVETEPLDISGATDDIDARLKLALPQGVSVVGDETVLVQVGVAAIESSITMTVPVEVTGLAPGLSAEVSPKTVDVILAGPLPVLDGLQPSAVRAVVDLSTYDSPGVYQIAPQVEVLKEHVRVESYLPVKVEVTVQRGSSMPTHTPPP